MIEQAAEVLAGTPVATSEGGADRVVLLAKVGSLTVEADVWVEALNGAIEQFVVPKVCSTDQGIRFTGESLLHVFEQHHIRLSMDGKARWRDNVFVNGSGRASNTKKCISRPTARPRDTQPAYQVFRFLQS